MESIAKAILNVIKSLLSFKYCKCNSECCKSSCMVDNTKHNCIKETQL